MYLHVDIVSNLESRYIVFSCSSPLHSQTSNLSTVNFQRATVADRQNGAAGRAAASQLQQPEFCLGLRYHVELAHSLCKLVGPPPYRMLQFLPTPYKGMGWEINWPL